LAAVSGLGIVFSLDSGATWTPTHAPAQEWNALACSSDGRRLVAASDYLDLGISQGTIGGNICTLQLPLPPPVSPPSSSPSLSIGLSDGALGLSWLVPSTSFVLQQNHDLNTTNWIDLPMSPTLNFTNLNYQVTVPPSLGSQFYRLRQQ
jgi:hypothetical protein